MMRGFWWKRSPAQHTTRHTHNRICLPVFVPEHTDACMVWIVPCESLCQEDGARRVESTSDQEDRKPARAHAGKRKRATDVDSAAPPTASPDKWVCARVHVFPQPHRHWRGLSHICACRSSRISRPVALPCLAWSRGVLFDSICRHILSCRVCGRICTCVRAHMCAWVSHGMPRDCSRGTEERKGELGVSRG